ncbi:MAG: transposase [Bradyrhizobium sp.]|nr:transposase [Bradyrhizobium sp.]
MRKQLYWLSEEEWRRIEPLLPHGRRGAHRVDDRRVISGILHMLRSGARWRDCPPDMAPYTTIYDRFNRRSRQGIWLAMFKAVTDNAGLSIVPMSRRTAARRVEKGGLRRSHRALARRPHDRSTL